MLLLAEELEAIQSDGLEAADAAFTVEEIEALEGDPLPGAAGRGVPVVIPRDSRVRDRWRGEQNFPPDVLARVQALLERADWIYAKTMPHIPHFYTLRKTWVSREDWDFVVQAMWDHGYSEVYGTRTYHGVANINGWKYWTMDYTVESTDLINRKRLDNA